MDRRRFLAGTTLLGIGQAAGIALAAEVAGVDAHSPITLPQLNDIKHKMGGGHITCMRTPEANDGPYYYPSSPQRRNLTEGRKGVPLKVGITVANAGADNFGVGGSECTALTGAIVDVWHCDADGLYSNVGGDLQNADTVGMTFMRGHQLSDKNGYAEFETVVPGWELIGDPDPAHVVKRATHIHVKVFQENKVSTAQLYFPDAFLVDLYQTIEPYKSHRKMTSPGMKEYFERVYNADDPIFTADNSRPMQVRKDGDGYFVQATIALNVLGSRGVPSLFR